jgi:hypothetical protein
MTAIGPQVTGVHVCGLSLGCLIVLRPHHWFDIVVFGIAAGVQDSVDAAALAGSSTVLRPLLLSLQCHGTLD